MTRIKSTPANVKEEIGFEIFPKFRFNTKIFESGISKHFFHFVSFLVFAPICLLVFQSNESFDNTLLKQIANWCTIYTEYEKNISFIKSTLAFETKTIFL